jgi:hypothetical protein
MNNTRRNPIFRPAARWLAAAGIAAGMMVPISASANVRDNGAIEILASAAVAYVVVDAVGGFDDKDRHRSKAHKRDGRHDRQARSWEYERQHRSGHDGRRHDRYWYGGGYRDDHHYYKCSDKHSNKHHEKHDNKHQDAYRRHSDRHDHRGSDRYYRHRAYH